MSNLNQTAKISGNEYLGNVPKNKSEKITEAIQYLSELPIEPNKLFLGDLGIEPDEDEIEEITRPYGKKIRRGYSYSPQMMLQGESSLKVSESDKKIFNEAGLGWEDVVRFYTYLGACCMYTYNEGKKIHPESSKFSNQTFPLKGFEGVNVTFPFAGAPEGFDSDAGDQYKQIRSDSKLISDALLMNSGGVEGFIEPKIIVNGAVILTLNSFTQMMAIFHHLLQKGPMQEIVDYPYPGDDEYNAKGRSGQYAASPSDVIELIKKIKNDPDFIKLLI